MVEFILLFTVVLLLSAIFANGFYNITRKGMIFGFWETFILKLPKFLSMPLGGCITCQSSIFGTICWIFWYQIAMRINSIHSSVSTEILIGLPIIFKIGLWVFFFISLAWGNEIIFNINHTFKKNQNEKS